MTPACCVCKRELLGPPYNPFVQFGEWVFCSAPCMEKIIVAGLKHLNERTLDPKWIRLLNDGK